MPSGECAEPRETKKSEFLFFFLLNETYISDLDLMHFSVPPTKIEISGHRSGSRLEVRENEEVELRCIVHDAKPKANIVWYRQNVQYITGRKETVTLYVILPYYRFFIPLRRSAR